MSRFLILLEIILVGTVVRGQEPYFRLHQLGDAAQGMVIHDLLQDRQGLIWLGTSDGLMSYDGIRLQAARTDSAFAGAPVTALFEDSAARLWAGTAAGKVFYLDPNRRFVAFDPEEGSPVKSITGMAEDAHGQIWMATYGEGVYVFTGERVFNVNMDDGLAGNDIYDLAADARGAIWLATDNGISICTFQEGKKSVRHIGLAEGLPDQLVTRLLPDSEGGMWIGTFEAGVVRFDPRTGGIQRLFPAEDMDEISALSLYDNRELWIGTRSKGVWRYQPGSAYAHRLDGPAAFSNARVSQLLGDAEGNIWTSFEDGRLVSAFRPFEQIDGPEADMQTLLCDKDDNVWVGTRSGLYRLQRNRGRMPSWEKITGVGNLNITDLEEDPYGHIWIGTLDRGLFVYQPGTGLLKQVGSVLRQGGLTIMSLALSRDRIWLATLEGVLSFPLDENIFSQRRPSFTLLQDPWESQLHFVFHIYVDREDRVWFATDGNGVFVIEGGNVRQVKGNDSLTLRTVYAVSQDQVGRMWFNTPDHGLVEFDGQAYRLMGVAQGLTTTRNASMLPTRTGDLLIIHDEGIELMETARRHVMYYDDEIGARDIQPALNAIAADGNGMVYVGGRRRLVAYTPTTGRRSIHPRTRLTEVNVFGNPVDVHLPGALAPDQNFISFKYIGLWYTSPSAVRYLYKLEGYDREWKESRDLEASYSDLRPGTYTFWVKASENNYFLDEPAASYTFTIRKHYWQRPWFVGLAGLGLLGLLYAYIRARDARATRQAMLKREMVESQLAALKAQINPHFLFNSFNTLITIIDENAENPRLAIEYVEKLADFYRSILQYREQELISLEEEWDLVQHYSYLLTKRYGANLHLHLDAPPSGGMIMPLTLQILVENAVKHNVISETRPLDIHITVDADGYVTVRNTLQPKSGAEPSTRFGLQSIIKRYQLLSDRNVIVDNSGDAFVVRVPVVKRNGL